MIESRKLDVFETFISLRPDENKFGVATGHIIYPQDYPDKEFEVLKVEYTSKGCQCILHSWSGEPPYEGYYVIKGTVVGSPVDSGICY